MSELRRSVLDLVDEQFRKLSRQPNPITVDGASIHHGLPQRLVPLEELRRLLLDSSDRQLKDNVWAHLVRLARLQEDPWTIVSTGMMIPGLRRVAAKFGAYFPGDQRDLESEILEAFLTALKCADPNQRGLPTHLYGKTVRHAHKAWRRERQQVRETVDVDNQNIECPCGGNPDLVLAQAVREGVVTTDQADLICGVHLDCTRRDTVIEALGLPRRRVKQELASARRRLSAYLVAA